MPTAAVQMGFEGGKELEAALRRLDITVQEKALKAAVRASARPVIKMARALVPMRFGFLRRSLGVRLVKYRSGTVVAIVGAKHLSAKQHHKVQEKAGRFSLASKRAVPALYAHLVEHGTQPHAQRGVVLPLGIRLNASMHPGARAQPFLGPALAQTQRRAQDIMRTTLWAYIRKATR